MTNEHARRKIRWFGSIAGLVFTIGVGACSRRSAESTRASVVADPASANGTTDAVASPSANLLSDARTEPSIADATPKGISVGSKSIFERNLASAQKFGSEYVWNFNFSKDCGQAGRHAIPGEYAAIVRPTSFASHLTDGEHLYASS